MCKFQNHTEKSWDIIWINMNELQNNMDEFQNNMEGKNISDVGSKSDGTLLPA